MSLQKTTILSNSDTTAVQQQYQEEISEDTIIFVALGDTEQIKQIVKRADKIAGTADDLRKVVWVKNPEPIERQIVEHQLSEDLEEVDIDKPDWAFTLSFNNVIRDVIRKNEGTPDSFRIFKAYAKAEANGE